MDVDTISYPVLCGKKDLLYVMRTPEELQTCTRTALRKGWYENLLLLDSGGRKYRGTSATKLHGVGPFWGYNIFLNQRIRVSLAADEEQRMSLEEVKALVQRSIGKWHTSRDDTAELKRRVAEARSLGEVINFVAGLLGMTGTKGVT